MIPNMGYVRDSILCKNLEKTVPIMILLTKCSNTQFIENNALLQFTTEKKYNYNIKLKEK